MDRRMLGSLGEAKATLHFVREGYDVFTPSTINPEVDLIVYKEGVLKTVQVKSADRDEIKLQTCYKTTSGNISKCFDATNYDILFVYHHPSNTIKVVDAKLYHGRSTVRYKKL